MLGFRGSITKLQRLLAKTSKSAKVLKCITTRHKRKQSWPVIPSSFAFLSLELEIPTSMLLLSTTLYFLVCCNIHNSLYTLVIVALSFSELHSLRLVLGDNNKGNSETRVSRVLSIFKQAIKGLIPINGFTRVYSKVQFLHACIFFVYALGCK